MSIAQRDGSGRPLAQNRDTQGGFPLQVENDPSPVYEKNGSTRQTGMNKHKQARAEILREAGNIPHGKSRMRAKTAINVADYCPAPPPSNLLVQAVGDCLIWTGQLNRDGYGVGDFRDGVKLSHIQAYTQSRRARPEPGRSICHFCHRPYCIQPSHLYEGDNKTNSNDRKLRVGKGSMALVFQKHDEMLKAAKYRWAVHQQTRRVYWSLMQSTWNTNANTLSRRGAPGYVRFARTLRTRIFVGIPARSICSRPTRTETPTPWSSLTRLSLT